MTQLFNKIYIVPKINTSDDPLVRFIIQTICVVATTSEPMIQVLAQIEYDRIDDHTLIIAIGGDGTMLQAMRLAATSDTYVTGINIGQVGFLTDFVCDKNIGINKRVDQQLFDQLLAMFAEATTYPIEKRMALKLLASNTHDFIGDIPVFNEFVLSNVYSDQLIRYHLKINGIDAGQHKANGIIVGTPTGSTAYTLSNGGGLILPSMNIMQIVPIAPLSMSSRPIIVPGDNTVSITVETQGSWTLKGDGNTIAEFDSGLTLDITEYHGQAKVIHSKEWNFFDMLTNKLHWRHT